MSESMYTGSGCYNNDYRQVYLIIPMDRATLLHVKSTILHCPSIITRQRASVDCKLLGRPRNVCYYHIFER